MKIVALVSCTRPHLLDTLKNYLTDCDEIIIEIDVDKRGAAHTRNKLLERAPSNSIVRFIDDDDIPLNTKSLANYLIETDSDIVVGSIFNGQHRSKAPENSKELFINNAGPWSWVAKIESIRHLKWDTEKKVLTGTWHFLSFIDSNLKIKSAPHIWCYHWIPTVKGMYLSNREHSYLIYPELYSRINKLGDKKLLLNLAERLDFDGYKRYLGSFYDSCKKYKDEHYSEFPEIEKDKLMQFSQKVLFRKLFDRNPLFKIFADKLACRDWVKEKINDINFTNIMWSGSNLPDVLPDYCFIKANHGSGWNIAYDASTDESAVRYSVSRWLQSTYAQDRHEWAYKYASKKIIIEERLDSFKDLVVFCFNGEPRFYRIADCNNGINSLTETYDIDSNSPVDCSFSNHRLSYKDLEYVKKVSKILSKDIDMIRVDFLHTPEKIYFNEMTFYPGSRSNKLSKNQDILFGQEWNINYILDTTDFEEIVKSCVNSKGPDNMIVQDFNFLSEESCLQIIELAKNIGFYPADLYVDKDTRVVDTTHRTGSVCFIKDFSSIPEWDKIVNRLLVINSKSINTHLESFSVQIAEYMPNEVAFNWHTDDDFPMLKHNRKITAIIPLSRPYTYEGGELHVHDSWSSKPDLGTLVMFPSFLKHQVTPITSGIRYSMTIWGLGPNWR